MPLAVSVIIANYNYAGFVASAIESALALDWPDVEVVVVDDGSTDDSVAVIERYADRVTLIRQANAGQVQASRAGFARSTGDLVVFLDSDDLLEPELIREVARHWTPKVSKAQVQMALIGDDGTPLGSKLPQYFAVPEPPDIRRWMLTRGEYPAAPGSANVYARWFVEEVFSTPTGFNDWAMDSYFFAAAPMLGDVVTVAKPLVRYRIHGDNACAQLELVDARFAREVSRAEQRHAYGAEIGAARGLVPSPDALDRSLTHLGLRLASFVLRPDLHPVPGDGRMRLIRHAVRAAASSGRVFSPRERIALAAWTILVCALPRPAARALIGWRYAPATRPRLLLATLQQLGVVRR